MNLSDLVFDRRCVLCDEVIKSGAVCSECIEKLLQAENPSVRQIRNGSLSLDAVYLFDYENETVKSLLFALKKCPNRDLMKFAASLYAKLVPQDFCGVVTYCPRGKSGYRNNGFDQVAEPCKILCRQLSDRLKFAKLLKRRGTSKQQKKLLLSERRLNVSGKFRATKKDIHSDILLVDDVVTSGSTAIECASEIKRANPNANIRLMFLASR